MELAKIYIIDASDSLSLFIISWTTIVVHNRDRPEIYKNPLIERTITGLMGHIEKRT